MSVQFTNKVSQFIVEAGVEITATAWAATSYPMGAVGGGVFGAVRHITDRCLTHLTKKILNTEDPHPATDAKILSFLMATLDPHAGTNAKILSLVIVTLGSFGAAWATLAAAGFCLTASHVVEITLASLIGEALIRLVWEILGMSFSPEIITN